MNSKIVATTARLDRYFTTTADAGRPISSSDRRGSTRRADPHWTGYYPVLGYDTAGPELFSFDVEAIDERDIKLIALRELRRTPDGVHKAKPRTDLVLLDWRCFQARSTLPRLRHASRARRMSAVGGRPENICSV
jgi:hypothetical protein